MVDKGIVLVCSVGNLGVFLWKKIMILGDVENVLMVGVIDWRGVLVLFFFIGNIVDNCVKFDVVVVGLNLDVMGINGNLCKVSGILFVLLILCGMVVCLW